MNPKLWASCFLIWYVNLNLHRNPMSVVCFKKILGSE